MRRTHSTSKAKENMKGFFEMTIALIAHDAKKELMVQFCIAYCGILSRYNLVATGATGKTVSEATGLEITKFLGGSQGGVRVCAFAMYITFPLRPILPPPRCLFMGLNAVTLTGARL